MGGFTTQSQNRSKDAHGPLRDRAELRRAARPRRLDHAGIRLVNDDVGVRWVYSFLSADKKKTYCLYEAPNPEAISEAAARLGIPADVIVAVEQFGPDAAHRYRRRTYAA